MTLWIASNVLVNRSHGHDAGPVLLCATTRRATFFAKSLPLNSAHHRPLPTVNLSVTPVCGPVIAYVQLVLPPITLNDPCRLPCFTMTKVTPPADPDGSLYR